MTTLIFPAGMPRAIAFLAASKSEGGAVVGASSVGGDPSREHYETWAHLPYITDERFSSELADVIHRHRITKVFTANPAVWKTLNTLLPSLAPAVQLIGGPPEEEMLAAHRTARQVSQSLWEHRDFLAFPSSAKPRFGRLAFTAMVRHTEAIPGMCDHQKMLTLSEVFRLMPDGDIVEIGSWWGKSAFVLSFLARQYKIGSVICVDPWSDTHLVQKDALVDSLSADLSADEAHSVFLTNLFPYASGDINYLRMPSVEGAAYYRGHRSVSSVEFGETQLSGSISLLHIDGNHHEDAVEADLSAWEGQVKSGGWIVFDDYKWPYGDGPRLVADRYLDRNCAAIERAFFTGGALFVQLR